jgi:hypothetical protein
MSLPLRKIESPGLEISQQQRKMRPRAERRLRLALGRVVAESMPVERTITGLPWCGRRAVAAASGSGCCAR